MPVSDDFAQRLEQALPGIVEHFGTPFHLYDEKGIRATATKLIESFAGVDGFHEYFAVKALPNPEIMRIMHSMGFGFDCSSIAELALSRRIGARGEEIMFTSNNTSQSEFAAAAADGGCVLNLDDMTQGLYVIFCRNSPQVRRRPGDPVRPTAPACVTQPTASSSEQ